MYATCVWLFVLRAVLNFLSCSLSSFDFTDIDFVSSVSLLFHFFRFIFFLPFLQAGGAWTPDADSVWAKFGLLASVVESYRTKVIFLFELLVLFVNWSLFLFIATKKRVNDLFMSTKKKSDQWTKNAGTRCSSWALFNSVLPIFFLSAHNFFPHLSPVMPWYRLWMPAILCSSETLTW